MGNSRYSAAMFVVRVALLPLFLWGLVGCSKSEQSPDPVVADFVVAYVKRPLTLNDAGEVTQKDQRRSTTFNAGGDLYIKERASPSAAESNITVGQTEGLGDVKDIEVSYDGTKILFALRMPEIEGADADEQPTWNIWEYSVTNKRIRRIIASDIVAEEGQDIAPHYLPDGRIIFASTRQRQSKAMLLDESKPQYAAVEESRREPAFVLHVMNSDGSDIHQISFNQSHDFDPTVLANGRILFTRWDQAGGRSEFNLYTMNPDGTDVQLLYGSHSHATGTNEAVVQFLQPRELAEGGVVTLLQPFRGTYGGGDIVKLNILEYADYNQTVPLSTVGAVAGGQGTLSSTPVTSDTSISLGGRYSSVYPFWDGTSRMLVSWTPCRVVVEGAILPCTAENSTIANVVEAQPLYGIYVYDQVNDTQLPVVVPEEGMMISDVVAAQPRTLPTVIHDKIPGIDLNGSYADEAVGVLHIRSVYDMDGTFDPRGAAALSVNAMADPVQTTAAQRPAHFLRIEKSVSLPDRNTRNFSNSAFGLSSQQLMREIIGYIPIEPDGSVKVKVPANVPIALAIVDANGHRIGERHRNWLVVRPGEVVECNGCHLHSTGIPHGRAGVAPAVNQGAATTGLPFPNTTVTWVAQMGETMAEAKERLTCQTGCTTLNPSVDLRYTDLWTDPAIRAKDPDINYLYSDLTTALPVAAACVAEWTAACRIVINYEKQIHPLWGVQRKLFAADGVTETADHTCNTCHSSKDALNVAQVPAGQLDLSDGESEENALQFRAYRELLAGDNIQELNNGALIDRRVPVTDAAGNPLFEVDESGNVILDANGQSIPRLTTLPAPGPFMSTTGANGSSFFSFFASGAIHAGWLSQAELRLLAEWLDIGAQYYNNPFDAPLN